MERDGKLDGLSKLPIATCLERESGPGGVWRSRRSHDFSSFNRSSSTNIADDIGTNMYEALWTNGAKKNFEFFDYTYQDHFNQSLPVYLPRAYVLDYILQRVKNNNPYFFNSAKFNTEVQHVKYNEALTKFEVEIQDLHSHVESTM